MLQQLPGVDVIEVRNKEELHSCAGLIIPGGESTTMALVAERWGLITELQSFAKQGKPIWGTCAGMIFLAERAEGVYVGPPYTSGGAGGAACLQARMRMHPSGAVPAALCTFEVAIRARQHEHVARGYRGGPPRGGATWGRGRKLKSLRLGACGLKACMRLH